MCCPPSTLSPPPTAGQCRRQNWRDWPTLSCMLPTCTGSWWRTRRGGRLSSRGFCAKPGWTTPTSMWRHPGTISFGGTRETLGSPGAPCSGTLHCDGWERHSTSTAARPESSTLLMMTTRTAWSCLRRWALGSFSRGVPASTADNWEVGYKIPCN